MLALIMLFTFIYVLIRYVFPQTLNVNPPSQTGSFASTLGLGFLFGGFDLDRTKIIWDWTEPVSVGNSMAFYIYFYKQNGERYSAHEVRNLTINIVCKSMTIAHVVEVIEEANDIGTDDSAAATKSHSKVSFLVRASGVYTITIKHNNKHIKSSPFIKVFLPQNPVASRTTLIRPLESCKFLPVTQNQGFIVEIEPRDEFGNNCTSILDKFIIRDDISMLLTDICDENNIIPWSTDISKGNEVINLDLFVPISGCFHVVIKLFDQVIINGDFDIVVLTPNEAAVVHDNLRRQQSLHVYYEAKLLESMTEDVKTQQFSRAHSMGDMLPSSSNASRYVRKRLKSANIFNKSKKVYIYITPKQLIIKEFFLKFIPRRLQSFRLCQGTQISLGDTTDYMNGNIVVSDGFQPSCQLWCTEAKIVLATFFGILSQNSGGSKSFDDKREHFYREIVKTHKLTNYRNSTTLFVNRDNLLQSSYKATKRMSESDWCKQFVVKFSNEEGLDWGGLNREWIQELCKLFFNPPLKNEQNKENTFNIFQRFSDESQALVLPKPCEELELLKYYEFAGKIIGKCIIETAVGYEHKRQVNAKFARSFLAQIIGLVVTFRHFESDDPELFKTKIRYIIENDVADLDLTFSDEVYDDGSSLQHVANLKHNGSKIAVTNETKFEYLNLLAQYRLSKSIKNEMEAIMKGINLLIPDHLLSIFDEYELELILCGSSKISVDDLRRNCIINDNSDNFKRILEWFWSIISNFTQDELARMLQFTTGCSQLPTEGFEELKPQFKISFSFYNHNNLPTAHTCFNELCLPLYDSHEIMHKMLKLAINEGATGFGLA